MMALHPRSVRSRTSAGASSTPGAIRSATCWSRSGRLTTTEFTCTPSNNHAGRDKNFQGFGRFLTGSAGEYYFRTVKPVLYPGRTRHIHFALKMKGREKWTTQCYVKGEPENERDGVFRGIKDPKARESVIVDFAPIKGSRIGELAARFDIVLGFTPEA